jgi:hypothetical protein
MNTNICTINLFTSKLNCVVYISSTNRKILKALSDGENACASYNISLLLKLHKVSNI